jgi:tetratricopeptide (TPR) repeat protein
MADIDALYKRAEEAFQKRSYDYARDLFLQILVLDPDHANARKALKGTLIRKFQESGATSKIRLIAMKGQFEIQLKTTKDALKKIDLCQNYLKDDPTNSKVRGVLAEALYSLGHNNAAAAEAEMSFADDTSNLAAAKVMVAAYKNTGKVKEAQTILERLQSQVKEDRDLEKLQRDLAAMQTMNAGFTDAGGGKDGFRKVIKDSAKAEDLERDHRLIQSEAELAAAFEKLEAEMAESPTDARIPKRIGDLFFDKKKDYLKARDWYKKASQLAPQDSVLRDKVDDCQIRMYDVQVEAATKANDPKLNELKGVRLKFMIQSFERRVQDRPTDMGLRLELGKAYYKAGPSFTDKAIGEFQQSVKDPKKKADSHLYLGLSFQRKKMFDMADKQYALAEDGILSQDRRLDILYNRARCIKEAGKLPEAIEMGKKIMEIDISYKDISQLVEEWQKAS